ncbi:hypothetical protein BaRGS_00038576 [Batillaria attramentaria]|uniref:Uncharacterized protein n=1 Tax=Batillaria attramentaria TaxID=370345 RepID=A0ABD0J5W0_9CAEN
MEFSRGICGFRCKRCTSTGLATRVTRVRAAGSIQIACDRKKHCWAWKCNLFGKNLQTGNREEKKKTKKKPNRSRGETVVHISRLRDLKVKGTSRSEHLKVRDLVRDLKVRNVKVVGSLKVVRISKSVDLKVVVSKAFTDIKVIVVFRPTKFQKSVGSRGQSDLKVARISRSDANEIDSVTTRSTVINYLFCSVKARFR